MGMMLNSTARWVWLSAVLLGLAVVVYVVLFCPGKCH